MRAKLSHEGANEIGHICTASPHTISPYLCKYYPCSLGFYPMTLIPLESLKKCFCQTSVLPSCILRVESQDISLGISFKGSFEGKNDASPPTQHPKTNMNSKVKP
jgi:hypothetical protein